MTVRSRKDAREELGAILASQLTTAARVYTDQPTDFGGQGPVVVVASAGTERKQATFAGTIPTFYLDIYLFVLSVVKDADGNDVVNTLADDQLDTLEAAVAQVAADYRSAATWTAIGYAGRSTTEFVTVLDGSEYKRERIPLALTGKT